MAKQYGLAPQSVRSTVCNHPPAQMALLLMDMFRCKDGRSAISSGQP
jgi:hypothetical protein